MSDLFAEVFQQEASFSKRRSCTNSSSRRFVLNSPSAAWWLSTPAQQEGAGSQKLLQAPKAVCITSHELHVLNIDQSYGFEVSCLIFFFWRCAGAALRDVN